MGPYISFVLWTRNDGYAGGLEKCLWGIRYLAEQCDEFGLRAEAVVVEWNPVPGRPGVAEVLDALPSSTHLGVRVITVPPAFHARYRHVDRRPMHGAVAVNVGIRRARGAFAVCKAADVFYPDSVVRCLAKQALSPDRLYRLERWDVAPEASHHLGSPRSQFHAFCLDHVLRRNAHLGQPWTPFSMPDLFTNATGDFQLLSRESWACLRGYWETADTISHAVDSMLSYSAYAAGIREAMLEGGAAAYKIVHDAIHDKRVATAPPAPWLASPFLQGMAGIVAKSFTLSALFNHPAIVTSGVRKPGYQRSLVLFKILSLFPQLTYLKSPDWGLARESLAETVLRRAQWDL